MSVRRKLVLFLSVALLGCSPVGLVACGGDDGGGGDEPAPADTGGGGGGGDDGDDGY